MTEDALDMDPLRRQLLELLVGTGPHMSFEDAVADFPHDAMNRNPPNVPYTPWQLLEHIRLTQSHLYDYATNPGYVEREFPREFWPDPGASASAEDWAGTVRAYLIDRAAFERLVRDPELDLFALVPTSQEHTLLREIRYVADHTAYHIGEFGILRQVMDTWPAGRRG